MRFCSTHWAKLRDAIAERGLSSLIADSGQDVATKLRREAEEGMTIDTFEPLMGAHNAIVRNTLGVTGISVMHPNEDGSDRCPLCYLTAEHERHCTDPTCTADFETWIGRAADDQLNVWKGLRP